jgi:hypothetical protein
MAVAKKPVPIRQSRMWWRRDAHPAVARNARARASR